MEASATTNGKWSRWNSVLDEKGDKPAEHTPLRRVAVPLVCAAAVALVLVVLMPPFVCSGRRPVLSLARLLVWSLIAGGICAMLTAQGALVRWSRC